MPNLKPDLLQRLGLKDWELPATEHYPDGFYITSIPNWVKGYVQGLASHAAYDWAITWKCIREEHSTLNRVLPGDVWRDRFPKGEK